MAEIMKACVSAEFQWRERESVLIFINWAVTGPGAASFARPPRLAVLPGRIQKQTVFNVHHGSMVCLGGSGHGLLLPHAVATSKQTPKPRVWLCIPQKLGYGCAPLARVPRKEAAPCPSTSPLLPSCRAPTSPAGARLVPQKLMTSL